MRLPALLLTLLAISALTALGCGGGDDEDSTSSDSAATTETTGGGSGGGDTGKGGTVSISADPSGAFAYAETEVSAPTGAVEVDFENESGTDHDVVIEDGDGNEIARTDVISGDSTSTTADLTAGEYKFFCSVDGHAAAGMEGTLTAE